MTIQEKLIDECKNVFLKRLKDDFNIIINKNDIAISSDNNCLKLQYADKWSVFTKINY